MTRISASEPRLPERRRGSLNDSRRQLAVVSAVRERAHARAHSGFTLLELLLVLGIIAMAAVLVIPGLANLDSRGFSAQVRELSGLLNNARRTAVVQGQPARVEITAQAPAEDDRQQVNDPHLTQWFAEGISVDFADRTRGWQPVTSSRTVEFYPEGGSTGGDLRLQQGNRVVTLHIDPFSGRLTRQEASR